MEKEKNSEAFSEESDYVSVGLESESLEMKELRPDSKTETLASEEAQESFRNASKATSTINANELNDDDDEELDQEEGVRKPFLSKQVKFNEDPLDRIELVPLKATAESLSEYGNNNNQDAESLEREVETLLADTNVDAENADDETESAMKTAAKKTRKERLLGYLRPESELVQSLKPTKVKFLCISITFVILFIAVFLPSCIYSIGYDQMALARNEITGSVYNHTYGPGLHFMMPWNEWILFDKTAVAFELKNLHVFTTDKLHIRASLKLFYFFKKENLSQFYRKFGNGYTSIIESVCRSEIMNLGQKFSIEDYRTKRIEISKFFKANLASRLSDDYSIELFGLYMERIKFSSHINHLNLKRMLNDVYNEKAVHEKETAIIIKDTFLQTQKIKNEANIVLKKAEYEALNAHRKISTIDYQAKLEETFIHHLNASFAGLNFRTEVSPSNAKEGKSREKLMMSYCYYESLLNVKNPEKLHFNILDQVYNTDGSNQGSAFAKSFIGLSIQ